MKQKIIQRLLTLVGNFTTI